MITEPVTLKISHSLSRFEVGDQFTIDGVYELRTEWWARLLRKIGIDLFSKRLRQWVVVKRVDAHHH